MTSERSTAESGVRAEGDALPSYLRILPDFRVVLCITHSCCYTLQNLSRHLLEKHQLKSRERQRIESSSQLNDIATSMTEVVQPHDGINEIRGLPTVPGFICDRAKCDHPKCDHAECDHPKCDFRSTNENQIRKHYNKEHQWKVAKHGDMPWDEAYLQTLFQQNQRRHYFVVVLEDQVYESSNPPYIYPRANASNNAPDSSPPPVPENVQDEIMRRYRRVLAMS
ncbi:hypothetical protein INT44_001500 [Umbelopsis vinacea]|uniref:Uncharacterized protein n=1 Tax=Umbelopsis vinacea TaxID=44442 RepID=A0A8H7PRA9_9FUNG|nr:hypothetical protein INT44_001500 [Umbelopsis vinacea]